MRNILYTPIFSAINTIKTLTMYKKLDIVDNPTIRHFEIGSKTNKIMNLKNATSASLVLREFRRVVACYKLHQITSIFKSITYIMLLLAIKNITEKHLT